jgi:hypothetical protein
MLTLNEIKEIESKIPPVQNGPSSVFVQPDFGLNGSRGSYILYGYGNPEVADYSLFTGLEPLFKVRKLDWYINLLASDPEYLWVYQYQGTNELNWVRIFKIIPNTYTDKLEVDYINGTGKISLLIPKIRIPIEEQLKKDVPFSSVKVENQEEMLLTEIPVGEYVFRKDEQKFYKLTSAEYEKKDSWQDGVQLNILLDIENVNPTPTSFIVEDIKEVFKNKVSGNTFIISSTSNVKVSEPSRDITLQNTNSVGYIYIGSSSVSKENYGYRIAPGTDISFNLAAGDEIFAIAEYQGMELIVMNLDSLNPELYYFLDLTVSASEATEGFSGIVWSKLNKKLPTNITLSML